MVAHQPCTHLRKSKSKIFSKSSPSLAPPPPPPSLLAVVEPEPHLLPSASRSSNTGMGDRASSAQARMYSVLHVVGRSLRSLSWSCRQTNEKKRRCNQQRFPKIIYSGIKNRYQYIGMVPVSSFGWMGCLTVSYRTSYRWSRVSSFGWMGFDCVLDEKLAVFFGDELCALQL